MFWSKKPTDRGTHVFRDIVRKRVDKMPMGDLISHAETASMACGKALDKFMRASEGSAKHAYCTDAEDNVEILHYILKEVSRRRKFLE